MQRKLGNFIEGFHEVLANSESPKPFITWSALSTMASATVRKVWVQYAHLTWYLNLWVLLVAPPGVSRKSDGLTLGRSIISDQPFVHLTAESLTREYLVTRFYAAWETHLKQLLSNGVTEKEATLLANAALTVHSSEFGVFLGESDTRFINDLTDLFDCKNTWSYGTKTQGVLELKNVWLNILGGITPSAIRDTLPNFAIGGGFLSRFVLVCADYKEQRIPVTRMKPVDPRLTHNLRHDLECINQVEGNMQYSPDAAKLFEAWYEALDESKPPGGDMNLIHYVTRRPMLVTKVAALRALSKANTLIIDPDDFEWSVRVITDAENNMGLALRNVGTNRMTAQISQVEDMLATYGKMNYSKLCASCINVCTKQELVEILDMLETAGRISVARKSGRIESVEPMKGKRR